MTDSSLATPLMSATPERESRAGQQIADAKRSGTEGGPIPPTSVDLFCGAGGLSAGFSAAKLEVVAHADHWQPAVATLNANFNEARAPVDVAQLTAAEVRRMANGTPAVLAGGPPCQSFTSAGRRHDDDPRGTLVGVYARLAAELATPVVVFENVEGFLTAGGGKFVQHLLDPLVEAGYRVTVRKVNLANYGVPQHRKRVIAVASLLGSPPFPDPTHSAWGAPGAQFIPGLPWTPTVGQALAGLPPVHDNRAPQGHTTKQVGRLESQRIVALRPGQTMRDIPEQLWPQSYRKRAYRRVMDGTPSERRGGAPAGLRRLRGDQPSKAITSAAIREFVHPESDRMLSIREAARLQTFPDTFRFEGSASDQATLVGNAIPPLFAQVLGATIRDHLREDRPRAASAKGALIEFTVSGSETLSPALTRIVRAVRDRYLTQMLFT